MFFYKVLFFYCKKTVLAKNSYNHIMMIDTFLWFLASPNWPFILLYRTNSWDIKELFSLSYASWYLSIIHSESKTSGSVQTMIHMLTWFMSLHDLYEPCGKETQLRYNYWEKRGRLYPSWIKWTCSSWICVGNSIMLGYSRFIPGTRYSTIECYFAQSHKRPFS